MKGQSEHSITELLRRWLRGDARVADERRLNEAAAGDDFLRDALEGLRRQPESDHAAAVERLRQRLQQRSRRRGAGLMVLLPRLAAAATVALLLGLALWTWLRPEPAGNELATTETRKSPPTPNNESALPGTTSALGEAQESVAFQPPAPPGPQPATEKTPAPAKATEAGEAPPETSSIATAPAPPAADLAVLEPAAKPAIARNDSLEPPAGAAGASARGLAPPSPAPTRSLPREESLRTLTGQILTPQGEPVIAANVLLKGSTTGVVTDQNGRFAIPLPEGAQSLTISYLGFHTQEVAVARDDDSLRIVLPENPATLDEVVVIGFGRAPRDREAKKRAMRAPTPQPVGGFAELERYLRKNIVYPEAARQQRVEGTVRLEFRIQPDGAPTDFRVLDSLGFGCDAEAIRLLREGPKWQAPPGATLLATYGVNFQLPKR